MDQAEHLHLANGWTVSISDDLPPALCSIAAWPTSYGDPPRDQSLWFDFTDRSHERPFDMRERRCWTLEDMCEALRLVREASAPGAG